MKSIKKMLAHNHTHSMIVVVVVLAIAVVGVHVLMSSHAQTPYVAGHADQGLLSTGASVFSDPPASDGQAVRFGSPLAIHVSNGKLVNGSGNTIRLLGADETSTEEYCVTQNRVAIGALDQAEADGMASWHMNAVRIPLNEDCWLGINGAPADVSGINYQTAIKNFVTYLNNDGIYAILDLHYNAPGTTLSTSASGMPDEDHAPAFWTSVATTFKANPAVIYDLYNEPALDSTDPSVTYDPSSTDWACWLNGCSATINSNTFETAGMQQLINSVRATGATQPILLASLNEASDPCGYEDSDSNNAGSCMIVKDRPNDPLNQVIVDFHNYWGGPGLAEDICSNVKCWNAVLGQLNAAKLPWITSELGEFDCSSQYMTTYMDWADENNMSYMAWAWIVNDGPDGGYKTCTVGTSHYENTELLSTWSGQPSTVAPQGANFKAHLATVSPY